MKVLKLKECCISISDGDHLPPPKAAQGIPFITISNIDSTNHIDFSQTLFVPEEYYDNLDNIRKPKLGDIIYSVVGSFGKPVLIKDNRKFVFQRHIAILRPDNSIVDSRFLYFVMKTRDFYMQADSVAIGAAQRTISLSSLRNMVVSLPPLPIQQRIATILSRYDSLIENYQHQIKLLEEAAQRLYKEWFVNLKFPGYENTKIVDGVPEGWEKKKVGELLLIHMNGGWGKDEASGTHSVKALVIRGTDIDKIKSGSFDNLPLRFHTHKEIETKHLEANDIILELSNGNINNVGRTLFIDKILLKQICENVICASFCKFLRPVDFRTAIILSLEFQDMQNSGRMNMYKKNGTNGINNFDFQGFLNHQIIMPVNHSFSLTAFENVIKKISNHRVQIRHLTEARDRLLPKLMNGEIEV